MCFSKWYSITVCEVSRVLPHEGFCPEIKQKFHKPNIPTTICTVHPKPPDPPDVVDVEICESSRLLPNKWCPKRIIESFEVGTEPTETCSQHKEPTVWRQVCSHSGNLINGQCPFYENKEFPESQAPTAVCDIHIPVPADKTLIIYGLMGLFDDARFIRRENGTWMLDRAALTNHITAIRKAGANALRAFAWSTGGPRPDGKLSQFQPFVLAGDAWILGAFNDYYFPILRDAAKVINGCGLKLIFDYLNNCEVQSGVNAYSPFFHNGQNVNGFYDPAGYGYVKGFMLKAFDALAGLIVMHSFGNEMKDRAAIELFRHTFVPLKQERNIPSETLNFGGMLERVPWDPVTENYSGPTNVQDLIRGGPFEEAFGEAEKFKAWRNVHGCGARMEIGSEHHQAVTWLARKPPAFNIGPVIISDDGEGNGNSQCDWVWYGNTKQVRPSPEQWAATVKATMERAQNFSFEHCAKALDNEACQCATFRAMKKAVDESV